MGYNLYNHKPYMSYDKSKEIRARYRNEKKSGGRRRALERIENIPKDIMDSIYALPSKWKGLSTQEKMFWALVVGCIATAGVYGAAHYFQKPRADIYSPQIKGVNHPSEISPNQPFQVNFNATDMDAQKRISPENIAHASVRVTGNGYDVNQSAKNLEGELFSTEFGNMAKEMDYDVKIKVKDRAGNVAKLDRSVSVKDKPPVIEDFGVNPAQIGKGQEFTISVKGGDDVEIREALMKVDFPNSTSKDLPMQFNGTHFVAKLPAEDEGAHEFETVLVDSKNQTTTSNPIIGVVKYSFLDTYVDEVAQYDISEKTALDYYQRRGRLVEKLYDKDFEGLVEILKLAENNSTSNFKKNPSEIITNMVYRDNRVPIEDKNDLIVSICRLFNNLGIEGLNKMGSYWLGGNYSRAQQLYDYPRHIDEDIMRAINASETNPEIVDFSPTVLKGVDGKVFNLESNIPRETWMLVEHLKRAPYVVNYPEMFEALNNKIEQEAWCIFDDEYGPSYYDKKLYSPTDPQIWEKIFIPHWSYYWHSTPQEGNSSGRTTIFPWYNSALARQYIVDKTNRTVAEYCFWHLPPRTFNKETGEVVNGIEGVELFIQQLPKEYEEIIESYRTSPEPGKYDSDNPKWWWGQWFRDRSNHGLTNTVEQFKKVDNLLTDNWKTWGLIKFIYSYERYRSGEYEGEGPMYTFGLPLGFKSFGLPSSTIAIGPFREGIVRGEWSVSITDSSAKPLKEIGYGNMISMYSFGSPEDGVEKIYQYIRNLWPIYLWIKDSEE